MAIYNPGETLNLIKKHDFTMQKRYGQNFLVDEHILDKIIDAAELTKEDFVIEIGPGLGTMTQKLSEKAGQVAAVEIDKELIPILHETLGAYTNVDIIHRDILKMDLRGYLKEHAGDRPVKVVANLPYYITTPVIMELLEGKYPLCSITVMIQKEVAERMREGPGSKDYGALSLAVQYYSSPVMITEVPPSCFIPRPKVSSTVIRLDVYKKPPLSVKDEALMFRLIRASFNQRRKTLRNSLASAAGLCIEKEQVDRALRKMGLSETIRGEALTLEEFARLSDILSERS
ncbi:MAG: 16S rRNA (adenine(1518)-N(6)/adenine(1519)-N(6))-dimethyltransferase RsmA [Lachnospiraceae bacterium]|nr:16S rRNA (adenine(1518)-N(6)/adenine(1519)-N(6))-dimethyltransferase RsmA [Lachnospiraceae bacterium]